MDDDKYQDLFLQIAPIHLKEPLAETLGIFKGEPATLEYSFIDLVKMAGHACPTVAGAYLCCQAALQELYGGEIPVRGEISVTVHGDMDDGVYGVMGQAIGYITGAAPASGFRGLGHRFKRKDLLRYGGESLDPEGMCFEFNRSDGGKSVLVTFYPQRVPFAKEKDPRLSELLEKVIWEAANENEKHEFQQLWIERVRLMLLEKKDIDRWLAIKQRS